MAILSGRRFGSRVEWMPVDQPGAVVWSRGESWLGWAGGMGGGGRRSFEVGE